MQAANSEFGACLPYWVTVFFGEETPPRVTLIGFKNIGLALRADYFEGPPKHFVIPVAPKGVDLNLDESNLMENMIKIQNKAFESYRFMQYKSTIAGLLLNLTLLFGFASFRGMFISVENEPQIFHMVQSFLSSSIGLLVTLQTYYILVIGFHTLEACYVVFTLKTQFHVASKKALTKMCLLTLLFGWPVTSLIVEMSAKKTFLLKEV